MRISSPKTGRLKKLRLPYAPLPLHGKGIGISSLAKQNKSIESRWRQIRKAVFQRYGTICFYCGALPDGQNHDCHEVFVIDVSTKTLHLIDIVPACHRCHEWADGKVFLVPEYFRSRSELRVFLRNWLGDDYEKDPSYSLIADVVAYEAILHFRRVNRITIAQAKEYVLLAMRQSAVHDRVKRWYVDYGEWHWVLGLSHGELILANTR